MHLSLRRQCSSSAQGKAEGLQTWNAGFVSKSSRDGKWLARADGFKLREREQSPLASRQNMQTSSPMEQAHNRRVSHFTS